MDLKKNHYFQYNEFILCNKSILPHSDDDDDEKVIQDEPSKNTNNNDNNNKHAQNKKKSARTQPRHKTKMIVPRLVCDLVPDLNSDDD